MNGISGVDNILSQIRSMRQQTSLPMGEVGNTPVPLRPLDSAQDAKPAGFGDLLKNSVQAVNETQSKATQMTTAWERGDSEVSLTQVMVQLQKADVSFKAMMEVRNKMVDAYQEVMRMSI